MMQPMQPPSRMRYSVESRAKMVRLMLEGMRPQAAAAVCGASRATGYRLWRRFREAGWGGLADRPSTPRRQPRRLKLDAEWEILALRQRTNAGPQVIAAISGRPASTVGKVLRRWGCSRLACPERDPVIRYERERPGELVHVDTKKLGRFHVVGKRILKDGVNRSRRGRLLGTRYPLVRRPRHPRRTRPHRQRQGVQEPALAGRLRQVSHPPPLHPSLHARTNGKAEALIKTILREWAYRYTYPSSHHRSRALAGWIRWYNRRRPHGSLGGRPPISRVSHLRGQYI
jgi:transposase